MSTTQPTRTSTPKPAAKTATKPEPTTKPTPKGPVFDNARITAVAKQARTIEQLAVASAYTLDGRLQAPHRGPRPLGRPRAGRRGQVQGGQAAREPEGRSRMKLMTGRYATHHREDGVAVATSIGQPRWPLPYALEHEVRDLMPFGLFGRNLPWNEFEAAYRAHLERVGVERLRKQLEDIAAQHPGEPLVLLCWEKPGEPCHRRIAADWLEEHGLGPVREVRPVNGTTRTCPKCSHNAFWAGSYIWATGAGRPGDQPMTEPRLTPEQGLRETAGWLELDVIASECPRRWIVVERSGEGQST